MSLEICAELVKSRDPDRYRAAMTAPTDVRGALMAIYAFNAEVSHAVWATNEPRLAEIRLQYWHNQIQALFQGSPTDPHPVLDVLRGEDRMQWVAKDDFLSLIEARRWDAYNDPFENEAALRGYLMTTGGNIMAMASRILRMDEHYDTAIRDYGYATALAAFLVAVPKLKARGRKPLSDEAPEALRALAQDALDKMSRANSHKLMRAALPALHTGTEAKPVLKQVIRDPACVLNGTLERPEFQKRWRALWLQVLGRY